MDKNLEEPEQNRQNNLINLQELFEKFIGYWRWIVASVVFALIIGVFYIHSQRNIYQVSSSMLVIDQSKNGQMNEQTVVNQLDAVNTGVPSMVNDEEQVIHSTGLMKRVVMKLELYVTYTHKSFLRTEELYTSSPLYAHVDSTFLTNLHGLMTLQVTPENGKLSIKVHYLKADFELQINHLPAILKTPAGIILLQVRHGKDFPNEPIGITISSPVSMAHSLDNGALTTNIDKLTDVIELSLTTSNVQKGQDILNTLVNVYNQEAIESVNRSAINTVSFIDDRLILLTAELGKVEQNIENYKQTNNLTNLDDEAQVFLQKSADYEQQRATVETQLHLIKYIEDFLNSPTHRWALVPNLGLTDVGLVGVINQYNELVLTRERISHDSPNSNPFLNNLTLQIQTAIKAIKVSIGNTRKGLLITISDLEAQNALILAKIKLLPQQEREFIEIQRQQKVKESLYLFLLQKREEASLNTAITVPKGRVLNAPDDAILIGPHTSLMLSVFFFLGLFIPLLIIYFKDLFKTTLSNRQEVEQLTSIPVLVQLGHREDDDINFEHRNSANHNVELFRLLRTKLQFALEYPTQKVILVTSTQSQEGKSYVSINIAKSLSVIDKKVLLIGLDLRGPALAKHFEIDSTIGISSYLSGQESDYKSLIHTSSDYPYLCILPAGTIPPNPNELLQKKRLATLIEQCKQEYDYIVLDTAPVGVVSDSFHLDRFADITLYIIRAGYSNKRVLEFLNRMQSEGSLSHIYLILNNVNLDNLSYYHRGYSYGYGNHRYIHHHKK